jgi:hypothetical protein
VKTPTCDQKKSDLGKVAADCDKPATHAVRGYFVKMRQGTRTRDLFFCAEHARQYASWHPFSAAPVPLDARELRS